MTIMTMSNQKHHKRLNVERTRGGTGARRHDPTQGAHLSTTRIWILRGSAETDSSKKKRKLKQSPRIAAADRTRGRHESKVQDQPLPCDASRIYSLRCRISDDMQARDGKALHLFETAYASPEILPIGFGQRMTNSQVSTFTYRNRTSTIQHL